MIIYALGVFPICDSTVCYKISLPSSVQRHDLEAGGSIYSVQISNCYKRGLLSPRELVVKHLSAWVWPSCSSTCKLGVSGKPVSLLWPPQSSTGAESFHLSPAVHGAWLREGLKGALIGEHFHLEFLWEWAAGSATLNHSILRVQTFPSMTAKRGPHSEA